MRRALRQDNTVTDTPKKTRTTKILLIVWIVDSLAVVWLIVYIWLHGSTPDRTDLARDLGAIWGGTAAFLIGPLWKAVKQWPARYKKLAALGVFVAVAVAGGLFWIRSRQTAKLESLFTRVRELGVRGAPQKQLFMKLTRENTQTLPEYLKRCAELESVLNDYEPTERQMGDVMIEIQQEIDALNPKGSYANMLPMFRVLSAILDKDLEGAKAYRQEVEFAKQLPDIPESDRARFYTANIQPAIEQERRIGQDELQIMKDAKARGVYLPENMLQDAGVK
jgi:hypothetical protein